MCCSRDNLSWEENKKFEVKNFNRETKEKIKPATKFERRSCECHAPLAASWEALLRTLNESKNMPLFHKKKPSSPTNGAPIIPQNGIDQLQMQQQMVPSPLKTSPPPPSLVFHCQLANGSPTGLITGFSSVKELYQKIAECYDFSVDEVNTRERRSSLPNLKWPMSYRCDQNSIEFKKWLK